jgi:transcriptional regulator with XRE-family HTH domain
VTIDHVAATPSTPRGRTRRTVSRELGERLRRERTRRRERQIDAASRFKISQPSYHRWESGANDPDDAQFAEVANYLGIKVDEVWELVHGESPDPTSLEGLRNQVAGLERDIDDLRTLVRELAAAVKTAEVHEHEGSTQRTRNGAHRKPESNGGPGPAQPRRRG